jgi:hypothetical protein
MGFSDRGQFTIPGYFGVKSDYTAVCMWIRWYVNSECMKLLLDIHPSGRAF